MPELSRDGEVFVLNVGDSENRFHPDWVAAMAAALDEVATAHGPRALVTTASDKFYSNGLDLDWLGAHQDQAEQYVRSVQSLLAQCLVLPVPTVAAIQGHAFAAGGMLVLAHDFRVMRGDRGFFCLPEVDINIPFTEGMSALVQSRLAPQVAHEVMTTGRRYGGADALLSHVVDRAVPEAEVLTAALELARPLAGKAGTALGTIKARMYAHVVAALAGSATLSS